MNFIPDRVAKRIEQRGECHVWTGGRNNKGYGSLRLSEGKTALAHRFIYEQTVGPIPGDLTIDHLCRNKLCVNVEHLEVVTRSENSIRAWRDRCHEAALAAGWTPPTEEEKAEQDAKDTAFLAYFQQSLAETFGDLWTRNQKNPAA